VTSPLRIDWATHEAADLACRRWHYSKCMPTAKTVKVGAWEAERFIGVVIFSRGATPHIGSPYGMDQTEVCELTRVALRDHQTPVSRILSIAIRFLRKHCPDLRLIVSYADADQGHHGGIYQATNWIYTGLHNAGTRGAFIVNGKKTHPRSIGAAGGTQSLAWIKANIDANATEFITGGKHKYVFVLDPSVTEQIKKLAKPYPKRAGSADSGTVGFQPTGDGANPIPALQ
jgi:hypothetical protein